MPVRRPIHPWSGSVAGLQYGRKTTAVTLQGLAKGAFLKVWELYGPKQHKPQRFYTHPCSAFVVFNDYLDLKDFKKNYPEPFGFGV